MLKANRFGRYKKDEILNVGYGILQDGGGYFTATEIYETLKIRLSNDQKMQLCKGFVCKREWRGCIPVFDFDEILKLKLEGEL